MAALFFNRTRELAALERIWNQPGGQLVLVWGRRRTGKTTILEHFSRSRRAIYYTATQRAPGIELAAFSEVVRAAFPPRATDVLAGGGFRDWDEAFRYLAALASRERLMVVLDEFSYLVDADPSLPSVLQRFWDQAGRASKLRFVLCGSAGAILEDLGAARAPLFGRFTARMQVHPFGHRDAAEFHRSLRGPQLAVVHGIAGGMPLYLRLWDPAGSVAENLIALIGEPEAPLVNEGELLLRTELPEAAGYFRLMAAIASGRTRFSEIAAVAGMDPTRGLERLTAVRLIERRAPVTADPARTKTRLYRITDNFLSFWFRFVYPHRGEIDRGLGAQVVRSSVLPFLDEHMGPVFEEMARDHIRSASGDGTFPAVTQVGSWWSRDGQVEIDVVGLRDKAPVLVGEVKWSRSADRRVLRDLIDKRANLRRAEAAELALFARERFTGIDPGEAHLISANDLYR